MTEDEFKSAFIGNFSGNLQHAFPCGFADKNREIKDTCYWYEEEQDMGAHVFYCAKKGTYPLENCGDCADYIDRRRKLKISVEYADR